MWSLDLRFQSYNKPAHNLANRTYSTIWYASSEMRFQEVIYVLFLLSHPSICHEKGLILPLSRWETANDGENIFLSRFHLVILDHVMLVFPSIDISCSLISNWIMFPGISFLEYFLQQTHTFFPCLPRQKTFPRSSLTIVQLRARKIHHWNHHGDNFPAL